MYDQSDDDRKNAGASRQSNASLSVLSSCATPGSISATFFVRSAGMRDIQRASDGAASMKPFVCTESISPVPLSWLNSAWSPLRISGWSAANADDPISPSSSPLQWPTRIVRLGFG